MSPEPTPTRMRSDTIKRGDSRAAHRSLLRATGVGEGDWNKPFIAICNSHIDIIPGHVHLQAVGNYVKECVRAAGGVPFIFNTIGVDDGIAMGLPGNGTVLATSADRKKLYDLAARRVVAMAKDFGRLGPGHGLLPREIASASAFDNAMILDMAMGGSTNTVLHMLAIAHEA